MSEFLTGTALTDKIREIVGGNNVKCAVAYWGDHRLKIPKDCRIVCDIVGGSTSGYALEKLGAPDNANLKHVENLHAKVYISDRGVIVCSANASAGGLDCEGRPARLFEAGAFHNEGEKVWKQSNAWFDKLFRNANPVDQTALDLAKQRYKPPIGDRPITFEGMSVLQQIVADPDYFSEKGVGFLICRYTPNANELNEAAEQAEKSSEDDGVSKETLVSWERSRSFIGWTRKEMKNLNAHFIEFFLDKKGGKKAVLAHTYVHRFDGAGESDAGHFYTREPDFIIRLPRGQKFPVGEEKALSYDDWRTLIQVGKLLKNKDGRGIFDAHEFARLLRQAMEQVPSQPKIR